MALDPDYARVAARSRRSAGSPRRGAAVVLAALVAFGLLVTIAAAQARSGAPQLAREREALLDQIADRKADFVARSAQIDALRDEVIDLQGSVTIATERDKALLADLGSARALTGAVGVAGPGLRVVADDAPGAKPGSKGSVLDVDMQVLVNGLWQAGAEAISVNGNRLSPLSAIRSAGSAITVNYQSLSPPYVVSAIGDPDTLEARFVDTSAGQTWLDLKTNFGLRFDLERSDSLSLPAAPAARLRLQYAQRQGELP